MAYGRSNKRSHRSRHSDRHGRRGGKTSGGILRKVALASGIVLIPALTLCGGGYLAYQYANTEQMDAAFCYERDDQFQAAIFVDFSLTQQTSTSQRRDLKNAVLQTFEQLPPNGKVSVFTTASGSTSTVTKPVFELCLPARNANEQKRLGAPPKSAPKLKREYKDAREAFSHYGEKLLSISANKDKRATSSPILEQIQGISRYPFTSRLKKLVLYTDGINNSANGQFCQKKGELPRFEVYAKRSAYKYIKPDDLSGVSVNFLMIQDGQTSPFGSAFCTWSEVSDWWLEYFRSNGADDVRLTPLGVGAGA